MFDVIVIGARCAGAPTAMLLARRGHRVLLVDKAIFPSDTLSSHFIHPPGVDCLARWGLLDAVRRSNCPAVHQTSLDADGIRLATSPKETPGAAATSPSYCIRRKILDWILVQAAVEAGVEFREGYTAHELIVCDGKVTGLRGRSTCGMAVDDRARLVIGADGSHSMVARLAGAEEYQMVEPLTCNYYSYWSSVPLDGAELALRTGQFISLAPTNDGLTVINVLKPRPEFRQFRNNIEGCFLDALDQIPRLAERVRAGRREEPFRGTGDTTNFLRHPHGPGWALVGDAGHYKDAITAQGISDAFRDAERLSCAVHEGLTGQRPLEEALVEYHDQRDAQVMSMYAQTCTLARLAPLSGEQIALLEALRGNQADTDRFLATIAGTADLKTFYRTENVKRILRQAAV